MKIKIRLNVLKESLGLISSIPKMKNDSISNNLLIETKEQGISIKATNFEVTFNGFFPATVEEEGSICIQTSKLFNLVRNFTVEWIELQSTPQHWVYLKAGNSNLKLPGLESSAFPQIGFKPLSQELKLSSDLFLRAIDRTLFAIGENESRKNLMGLNLQVNPGEQIRWLGADAFRISHEISQLDSPIQAQGDIIIPKKSLGEIKRILDYCKGEVQIYFDENHFQIQGESVHFKTSLIEADYPNLDAIVNHLGPIEAKLPRAELIRAVRILNTLTDDDPNSVMKITLENNQALIESQKLEMGEGNDVIQCEYEGETISMGLNMKFFLDCLLAFNDCGVDSINLNLTGPVNPLSLTVDSEDNFLVVLMPVKIKW